VDCGNDPHGYLTQKNIIRTFTSLLRHCDNMGSKKDAWKLHKDTWQMEEVTVNKYTFQVINTFITVYVYNAIIDFTNGCFFLLGLFLSTAFSLYKKCTLMIRIVGISIFPL
jgi:hypothetical protein